MLRRIALVFWWAGALAAAGSIAAVFLFGPQALFAAVLLTLPAWTLAFVLGGSFWKPPVVPR